jgi:hypothetical protein
MRAPSTMYPAEPPLCRVCGGLFTNPSALHCRFCNHPANAPAPYRPQPMTGVMPTMVSPSHHPHAHPHHPHPQIMRHPPMPLNMDGGRTSFFWLRVAVIAIASCLSVVAACVSALAGE